MVRQAEKHNRVLTICHVLRYTPFFITIKKLLEDGVIGDTVTIEHSENVAYWHQAHSYVRGNWRNSETSSPMILAKSCHDLDIISWLVGAKCTKVSSFGSLKYFNKENAPEGVPGRCLDGCPHKDSCAFYAPRIYLGNHGDWQTEIIKKAISNDTSNDGLVKALKEGPYGRCVFHCDNNVVDHQVVNMLFEGDITASFTMSAFTYDNTRRIRILGTKGELFGDMEKNNIYYVDFLTGTKRTIELNQSDQGHGGGDHGIMKDFVRSIKAKTDSKTSAKQSLQSHLMAFAAEESRLTHKVVNMNSFDN
jgi:predicted dehydrogenase